ncbi:MAG: hypothetical protein Q3983_08245 [Capnocytophaga sp.]|nr:hypothetical protein [Capnocytophaga sp.]
MKRIIYTFLTLLTIVSCSKSGEEESKNTGLNIPTEAKAIIPEKILNEMIAQGMPINEGTTPPNIEGIYLLDKLIFQYTSDANDHYFSKGQSTATYKYKFYEQNGIKVKSDYKEIQERESATGTGVIISGSGNKFTIFMEHSAVTLGVKNKDVYILSGELTSEGIKNLVFTMMVTEKEDNSSKIIEVGVYRIFQHEGIAKKVTQY